MRRVPSWFAIVLMLAILPGLAGGLAGQDADLIIVGLLHTVTGGRVVYEGGTP